MNLWLLLVGGVLVGSATAKVAEDQEKDKYDGKMIKVMVKKRKKI